MGLEKNNVFPMHYAQTFHELLTDCGKDAVTFSRAGFTGSQKYPTFWAGDENSTWAAYRASINAGISASASGFFHWGWDIGGFSGELPSPELYLRGTAMATFCPIMQIHSEFNHHKTPSNDRTPWNLARIYNDPEILETFRKFSQLRNKLLPYLSFEGKQALVTGRPLMAGLFFDFYDDEEIWSAASEYMLGSSILVAPVIEPGLLMQKLYLPEGEWVSFWNDEEFTGKQWVEVPAPLNQIPAFILKDRAEEIKALLI
jgi:alpha-glucosidase (family GH31 glycosyl hydrolase)